MRPRPDPLAVLAGGLFLAVLWSEPAWGQHGGHHAGSLGGSGAGHHAISGGGTVAAASHHSGGAAGYGYGAAYGLPYGLGYGGYPALFGATSSPYGGGGVFSTATPTGGAIPYGSAAVFGHYMPLPLVGYAPPDAPTAPAGNRPPDNAGHFELILPPGADVFVNDVRTEQTGFVRHYNTPKLTPGYSYSYRIRIRYIDFHGEVVQETRDIEFKANDWFRIDFTRLPAPKVVSTK
jgi:uncharacterized protein (TIGR03000 family)